MLSHITETLTIIITNFYLSTGLLGIALAMAIESCCIPLPSEIVMPVAGLLLSQSMANPAQEYLLGTHPVLPAWVNLALIALAGAIGCLVGSIVAYEIGARGGRPLMLKYGRYVLISQHDADKADRFFQRWGSATAFFSRLLPVVRTYISLPAGISRMPFGKFCMYTVVGSFPWCLLLAYLGFSLGRNLEQLLSPLFHGADVVILVVLAVLVGLYIWRHIRNDNKARAHQAAVRTDAAQMTAQMEEPSAASGLSQQQWNQPQVSQKQRDDDDRAVRRY